MYRFGVSPAAPAAAAAATAAPADQPAPSSSATSTEKRSGSSWDAKEVGGGSSADADYLYELGARQQYSLNVDTGQNSQNIDSLFTGDILGHRSDIADGSLRNWEFRTFNNIVGDYYVAPR